MEQFTHTQAGLRAALEAGGEVRSLGTVLGGYEILCAVRGGDRQPSIVITAGAHADELSGVYAAIRMAQKLDTPHQTFIIPVRDPFGFHGFRRAVQFCVGRPVRLDTPEDVVRVLKSEGELLHEDGSFASEAGRVRRGVRHWCRFPNIQRWTQHRTSAEKPP